MTPESEFLKLVDDNQKIIYKVCSIYCNNPADRDDLYQEILLNAWKGFQNFRNESKFSTWLYRVALNTAITGLKKQRRHPSTGSMFPDVAQLAEDTTEAENKKALQWAVDQLSPVEKALIMLFFEDYSYQEIGDILGITANNVGVRMNRIKARLKEKTKHFI